MTTSWILSRAEWSGDILVGLMRLTILNQKNQSMIDLGKPRFINKIGKVFRGEN